ncbi:MAG: NAD-dependent epimerase/dehydratase family protein [Bacteroidia bacterium]|nr:NAD-dependent epimerase/dehydratase family protein [Bacteroidia bacterium]
MENILVTGAAGFIGSHIAEYFCNKNFPTFCFIKKTANLQNLKQLNVEIIYGDITEYDTIEDALKGIDCVIHAAALAKDWGKYRDFYDVNVTGTLNVLKACKENKIENIIITGSISSYGEENCPEKKDETYPYNSHYHYLLDNIFPCKINYYRDTKALSSQEAIKYAKENNLNLTVIEPTWVYGEREFNTGFYEYLKTVKSNMPFFPGSKKNKFHVIYVGDLARAYFLAYIKNLKGINRIIVGNQQSDYMGKIYSLFCSELNIKKPANLPKTLIYPVGFVMELFYTLFFIKTPPLLTRGRVNMFYDNIEYSTEKAKKILSFVNEYGLEQGIKKTVKWYKENSYI